MNSATSPHPQDAATRPSSGGQPVEPQRGDTATPIERLLTVEEVANLLAVHPNYVYELVARGILPSFKIGGMRRIRPTELTAWLEGCRTGAASESSPEH
jgi:excisionase family DNA binding protein